MEILVLRSCRNCLFLLNGTQVVIKTAVQNTVGFWTKYLNRNALTFMILRTPRNFNFRHANGLKIDPNEAGMVEEVEAFIKIKFHIPKRISMLR
jgi:hypothetical protein